MTLRLAKVCSRSEIPQHIPHAVPHPIRRVVYSIQSPQPTPHAGFPGTARIVGYRSSLHTAHRLIRGGVPIDELHLPRTRMQSHEERGVSGNPVRRSMSNSYDRVEWESKVSHTRVLGFKLVLLYVVY